MDTTLLPHHMPPLSRDRRLSFADAVRNAFQAVIPSGRAHATAAPSAWDKARIAEALDDIDWYQFEKFNSALMSAEGWTVQHTGSACPDGGKDIVARHAGETLLVKCVHSSDPEIQEKAVRSLLVGMTITGIVTGAIHALHGFTEGTEALASTGAIRLHDAADLVQRARGSFSDADLTRLLASEPHRCPRCESTMVLRTGSFVPYWGCSRYPWCSGRIEERRSSEPTRPQCSFA